MRKHIHASILAPIIGIILTLSPIKGLSQTVDLIPEPGFSDYATYYISAFDMHTGSSEIQLCRYRLRLNGPSACVRLEFAVTVLSPQIGIESPITLVDLETDIIDLQADMVFDNRNISSETQVLYDVNGNSVMMTGRLNDIINPSSFDQILSSVITGGRLPDGEYTFSIRVFSGPSMSDLSLTGQDLETKTIQSPTFITLESPGGAISDLAYTQINSTLPIFNWNAQNCATCESYIRVAEYKPDYHSSLEEAIDDNLSLPFQGQGWESVGANTSFQYPVGGARPLEFGKLYVWQVKQVLNTTEGQEEILSPIWAFQIYESGQEPERNEDLDILLIALRNAVGDDQFDTLFGVNSELNGYSPNGYYTNDGLTIDDAGVIYILNEIQSGALQVTQIQIQE